ncbi:MAG TPA: FAD-dependent monooxygenase [Chthoniobacterales bacterium]|nr:FAD-dependent monooxygenase [Chthoniobacterales bacterium]
MATKLDALVVGAGPVGLSMAAALLAQGLRVRIIDAADDRAQESRAIGIQARTLEALEISGIVDEFLELGHRLTGVRLYGETGSEIGHLDFGYIPSRYPFILALPQSETERILGNHLRRNGLEIERRTALVGFEQSDLTVLAKIALPDGRQEEISTDWLLGCDGARSKVREILGLQFAGKTFDLHFLLGDLHAESTLSEDHAHVFGRPEGLLAFFPLGGRRYRLVADNPPEQLRTEKKPTLDQWQSIADGRSSVSMKLSDLGWTTYFRVNSRMVERLRRGRVFVLGDAAHIHSPALAQGMNTGIQDAWNLGWKLALVQRCFAQPALLDSFEQERMPVEHDVLRMTEFTQNMITAEKPTNRLLRDNLLPVLSGISAFQKTATKTVSETAIEYRASSVVEDHYAPDGPHAGDFAPGVILSRPQKNGEISLASLFGRGHVLLYLAALESWPDGLQTVKPIFGLIQKHFGQVITPYLVLPKQVPTTQSDVEVLIDVEGQFAQHYAASVLYLVRPDGYLAFRCLAAKHNLLESYIHKYFVPL